MSGVAGDDTAALRRWPSSRGMRGGAMLSAFTGAIEAVGAVIEVFSKEETRLGPAEA